MNKKLKLPFTDKKLKGGKSLHITNIIKKMFIAKNTNKINYIKASDTKDYYNKLPN